MHLRGNISVVDMAVSYTHLDVYKRQVYNDDSVVKKNKRKES